MRRSLITLTATGAVLGLAACGGSGSGAGDTGSTPAATKSKPAAPQTSALMIAHARRGCHTWLTSPGAKPTAKATLHMTAGGTLTITNNDVMPHKLLQKGGAAAQLATPNMNKMGSKGTITFPAAGTYTFATKAGEDYPSAKGVETVGPDNHLKLTVVVA